MEDFRISQSDHKSTKSGTTKTKKGKKGQVSMSIVKSHDPNREAPNLSASVMGMKFMKRKGDTSVEAEVEASKRRKLLGDDAQWKAKDDINSDIVIQQEPAGDMDIDIETENNTIDTMKSLNASQASARAAAALALSTGGISNAVNNTLHSTYEQTSLYSALPGRRSFGGFNKIVERQYLAVMDGHHLKGKYKAPREPRDKATGENGSDIDSDDDISTHAIGSDERLLQLAEMSEPALPGRAMQKKKNKANKSSTNGKKMPKKKDNSSSRK